VRDGLGPARLRLRGGSVVEEFRARFGPAAAAKVLGGEVVDADGAVLGAASVDVPPDDFRAPLRLLAHSLEFEDPVSGDLRRFVSRHPL